MPAERSKMIRTSVDRLWRGPAYLRVAILTILVLSAAVRVILAVSVTPTYVSDARDYRVLAQNLAEGRGYVQPYEGETEAFEGFTFRAFRPPGYPALLAGLSAVFGWGPQVYLVVNIVADLVTQVCFLLIAAYLLGAGPALAVQILLGAHVLWTPNPMTESLHTALFAVLALLLVAGTPLKSWRAALLFGVVATAGVFVRPITICVFPALAWRLGRSGMTRRGAVMVLVAALPAAACVTGWGVRNYRLFGECVLFTTNFGHHNAADFGIPADWTYLQLRREGLNEAQINRALVRAELRIAAKHPFAALMTWVTRAAELFSLEPAWEVHSVLWKEMFGRDREASLVFRAYRGAYAQYMVVYLAAAAGAAWLGLRRQGLCGLWSLMVFYVAIHALVSRGDIRLVAPLYPVLCVLAAAVWAGVQEHLEGARMSQASISSPPSEASDSGSTSGV